MKHILQVLKFEYLSCVKSKSFIISTIIFMLLIMFTAFIPAIISSVVSEGEKGSGEGHKRIIAVISYG